MRDLRYACRTILRRPLFAAVAVSCLGLGIGGTAAIFSLADAILWKSLPVERPDELAFLGFAIPVRPEPMSTISYPLASALRGRMEVFRDISVYRPTSVNLSVRGQTDKINAEAVSLNYFDVLGVDASPGRVFSERVDGSEATPTRAVLSHGYWQRRFGGDPSILDASVVLDGTPFSIVGVAREGFFGLELGNAPDLWFPVTTLPLVAPQPPLLTMPNNASFRAVARLTPSPLALPEIAKRAQPVFARIAAEEAERDRRGRLFSQAQLLLLPTSGGTSRLQRQFARPVLVVFAGAGILLAIGFSNLAALFLAQAVTRRREIAMRLALGASGGRLVRQLLTESVVLALMGGAFGVLFAYWLTGLLSRLFSNLAAIRLDLAMDWRTVTFSVAISLVLGVLLGLTPAIQGARASLVSMLQGDVTTGRSWRGRTGAVRRLLVGSQIALSLLLLVSAGLFGRSLWNLSGLNLGMRIENVLQVSMRLPQNQQQPQRVETFYSSLGDRLQALPGVRAVGASEHTTRTLDGINIEGYTAQPGEDLGTLVNRIGPGFVETLGLTVLAGRAFDERDTARSAAVAVVSRSLAVRFFGGVGGAIGRRVSVGFDGANREIVGVVSDASYDDARVGAAQTVYLPLVQASSPPSMRTIYVRSTSDPVALAAAVQREVHAVDPDVGIYDVKRLTDRINEVRSQERLLAFMSASTGVLSVLLTAIGIFGLLAYELGRRTREFGIRLALGATRRDIVRMVWRETLVLCTTSVAVGVLVALSLSPLIATQLIGVSTRDPLTIVGAVACIAGVLVVATLLPTLWGLRLSPVRALRQD
jgi:putative ABC transport system permease protein